MRFIKEHMATIVAGVVVVAALVAAFLLFAPRTQTPGSSLTAVIHDGDGGQRRLPMDENASMEIVTSLGRNVVVVENAAARIEQADCPNGSCMQQQPISRPGQQLICLPHRLWVEIVTDDNATSELDPTAVSYAEDGSPNNNVDVVAR